MQIACSRGKAVCASSEIDEVTTEAIEEERNTEENPSAFADDQLGLEDRDECSEVASLGETIP